MGGRHLNMQFYDPADYKKKLIQMSCFDTRSNRPRFLVRYGGRSRNIDFVRGELVSKNGEIFHQNMKQFNPEALNLLTRIAEDHEKSRKPEERLRIQREIKRTWERSRRPRSGRPDPVPTPRGPGRYGIPKTRNRSERTLGDLLNDNVFLGFGAVLGWGMLMVGLGMPWGWFLVGMGGAALGISLLWVMFPD